jgi:hypothetical protein
MDYKARFYDPYNTHRFIQPDTIIPDLNNPQSLNRYSYALNNPVRYSDSSGHCVDGITTILCAMAIGALIGVVVSTVSYAIVTTAMGGEITAEGLVGAVVGGAIAGAVSIIAAPLAGTVMVAVGLDVTAGSVAVGAAVVNAGGGALAYYAGGEASNGIDLLKGEEPQFYPTWQGVAGSAAISGGLSFATSQLFPVSSGQYSLRQAGYFLPRTMDGAVTTPNGINQAMTVVVTSAAGTGIAMRSNNFGGSSGVQIRISTIE